MDSQKNMAISQQAGVIKCDFESVRAKLQQRLEEYKGAVFTEDSKNAAKAEVASLRKEKKDFSDRVKEVKTAYMRPYLDFEQKAKELIALYDEPINLIDGQVKDFEEKRKEEKRERIHAIYCENVGTVASYIPLERIFNPRWENATMKEKDIAKEILELAASVQTAIDTIGAMQSEATDRALEVYKKNLSLPEAMTYINNYEKQKQEILAHEQERKMKEEQERIRREERKRIAEEQRIQAEKEEMIRKAEAEKEAAVEQAKAEAAQEVIDSLIPDAEGESSLYEYRMELTADAKEKLEMYLDSVGIEWELI